MPPYVHDLPNVTNNNFKGTETSNSVTIAISQYAIKFSSPHDNLIGIHGIYIPIENIFNSQDFRLCIHFKDCPQSLYLMKPYHPQYILSNRICNFIPRIWPLTREDCMTAMSCMCDKLLSSTRCWVDTKVCTQLRSSSLPLSHGVNCETDHEYQRLLLKCGIQYSI